MSIDAPLPHAAQPSKKKNVDTITYCIIILEYRLKKFFLVIKFFRY